MQQGWITLNRSILDNFVWADKPYNMGAAWIDLMLRANHEERKLPVGGNLISIGRGQLFTSSVSLSDRWGWSRTKVEHFLKMLEGEQMIARKKTANGQLLTIVNYSVYQDISTEKRQQKDSRKTAERQQKDSRKTAKKQQKDTNNNVNNENHENHKNNENNENKEKTSPYFPNDEVLDKAFNNFIAHRRKIKKPMTDNAIELMVKKISKMDPDRAVEVIETAIMNGWQGIYPDNKKNNKPDSITDRWGGIQ